MHHELIYKPQEGNLEIDEDDELLVDIPNGIILAGEQVLRHVQINLDKKRSLKFKDHHDFLSYIVQKNPQPMSVHKSGSGSDHIWFEDKYDDRVLYHSFRSYDLDNPEKVGEILGMGYIPSSSLLTTFAKSTWFAALEPRSCCLRTPICIVQVDLRQRYAACTKRHG